MLIHRTADFHQCVNQRLWSHDVSQSKRGTKNLADRACVNHSTSFIDPLQRREWRSDEAEFRVVVVLEHKSVMSAREIEQTGSALERHGNAERELVRRCHVDYFWERLFSRSSDHNSFIVERLRYDLNACQRKDPLGLLITRIFDPCDFTRVQYRHGTD